MADLRRFTETKTLQFAWSLLWAVVAVGAIGLAPGPITPVGLAVGGGGWLVGLVALGWSERRHWRRLVANSSFERGASAGTADLQQLLHGQSVTVATDVPGLLARTNTLVSAGIEGVAAEFTITLEFVDDGDADAGLETGNPAIDEAWIVEGAPKNVTLLLSPDVQAALMDVTVPGTATVTGERVVYRVPFTRLSAAELAACAEAVAQIAARLERVGRGQRSPTG